MADLNVCGTNQVIFVWTILRTSGCFYSEARLKMVALCLSTHGTYGMHMRPDSPSAFSNSWTLTLAEIHFETLHRNDGSEDFGRVKLVEKESQKQLLTLQNLRKSYKECTKFGRGP